MIRNTFSRNGIQLQSSTRRPNVSPGGTSRNAYDRVQSLRRKAAAQSQGHAAVRPGEDPAVEDANERNVEEAEAAVFRGYEIIDLTEEALSAQPQAQPQGRYRYKQVARNAPLESTHGARSVYRFGDIDLKLGVCVELREPFGKWEIQFIEIKSISVSNSDGSVIIRGLPYTRAHNLDGKLENKRNEVCQVIEIDADDQRSEETQALAQINLQQILRIRTLNKTNAIFPKYQYGVDHRQWLEKTEKEREKQAPLTCRWKFRIPHKDSRLRKCDSPNAGALVGMSEDEADARFRVPDKETMVNFRGRTHRGGSHKLQVIDVDGFRVPLTRNDRQYTFADIFCGAGGASRGAVMAGLKLVFGVDHWPISCRTWKRNFPGARMCEQDVSDFIRNCEIDYRSHPIDILHLSPPCQFWSPLAYPHAGRNNEENMAILFACPEVINKIRPRVFTLEQTFGLTHDAHTEFMNALIKGFTCHGYSVQWKIIPLVEYGLPQTRKRLVMMGACPGEQLPPWPPATHSAVPTRGLKPFVTEAAAIKDLNSRRVSLHDKREPLRRNLPPRNGNVPFPKTITCGGTQSTSHFSGERDFTLREIACLQGFPTSHQFEGTKTAIKKQIGNAFPPCVVKAFYDHIRTWLQRKDGVQNVAAQARPRQLPRPEVARHRRANPARASPVETQQRVNGNLNENEALLLALQESMRACPLSADRGVVEISDDEGEQQYSPVSAVAPLMQRMSIAPSDAQPDHGAESPLESRSRSLTLDFSPGPNRRAGAATRKRSLDLMHDGEVDDVMQEESPPKRERVVEGEDREVATVDHERVPSGLPRYAGPRVLRGAADDDGVAAGRSSRGSGGGVRESQSTRGGQVSHRGTVLDDVAPRESAIDWSTIVSQAREAGNSGNKVWTF